MKPRLAQMALDSRLAMLGIWDSCVKKIRRKYFKVTITADVRSKKLLTVDVKSEGGSEPKAAVKHIKLLEENGIKLKKSYGDD